MEFALNKLSLMELKFSLFKFKVWNQAHQMTHTQYDEQQRWVNAMKFYHKSRLYKFLCTCFAKHLHICSIIFLKQTQFAVQHHSVLLQNTFLFLLWLGKEKDKTQVFYHAYCLLIGINSVSLYFTTTSLEVSWIGRPPWIEKRISAKSIQKLLHWKKKEWFLNIFFNTDHQKQHKVVILEKHKYHNVLQIVQKPSEEILPQISDFTVKLTINLILNRKFCDSVNWQSITQNPSYNVYF